MRNRPIPILITFALLCTLPFLSGCALADLFPESQPSRQATGIVLETWPSFGDITEMRRTALALASDGTMTKTVFALGEDEQAANSSGRPALSQETRHASQETSGRILGLASSQDFMGLPDKVGGEVLDGEYQYITVDFENGGVRKGGLMPSESSQAFDAVCTALVEAWEQAGQTAA